MQSSVFSHLKSIGSIKTEDKSSSLAFCVTGFIDKHINFGLSFDCTHTKYGAKTDSIAALHIKPNCSFCIDMQNFLTLMGATVQVFQNSIKCVCRKMNSKVLFHS